MIVWEHDQIPAFFGKLPWLPYGVAPVPAFHDAVLENGALPLPLLENRIDVFITAARTGAGKPR